VPHSWALVGLLCLYFSTIVGDMYYPECPSVLKVFFVLLTGIRLQMKIFSTLEVVVSVVWIKQLIILIFTRAM